MTAARRPRRAPLSCAVTAITGLLGCGGDAPAPGELGPRVVPALTAALAAAEASQAPWRCGALDRDALPPAGPLGASAMGWEVVERTLRGPATAPSTIAFVGDAAAAAPATVDAAIQLRGQLEAAGVDLVVVVGGMGDESDELVEILAPLARGAPWPTVSIPGARASAPVHAEAVAALRADGVAIVDGGQVRFVELTDVTVATLPGLAAVGQLAAGVDGCGHADDDLAALRAAWPGPAERAAVLAGIRAPRAPSNRGVGGVQAGDRALAKELARPGGRALDAYVHPSLDGRPAAPGRRARADDAPPASIAVGPLDAEPALDLAGGRITPSAMLLEVTDDGLRWRPVTPPPAPGSP
ncbi:MAG: hypothetical protein R2939_19390 [Kofleriaceae bacterium]